MSILVSPQLQAELLQVRCDILPREALHIHGLHVTCHVGVNASSSTLALKSALVTVTSGRRTRQQNVGRRINVR